MKIKTVVDNISWPGDFDEKVNEAIDEGWQLVKRETVGSNLYAQLVLPDPAPVPEPMEIDGIQALHIVKAACLAHKGPCNDCPMTNWCEQLQHGGDPTDWDLPELED